MPKVKAVKKLERSKLPPRRGGMSGIDIRKFVLYLNREPRGDIADRIISASINRTIEGASTLDVTINDYDRRVLRSGLVNQKVDVEIDGLWFRLAEVEKQGDNLTLTFEDREVAVLRTYNKKKMVKRDNATRAEFIINLIREVKEFYIPVVIPEKHKVQPIEKKEDTSATYDGGPQAEADMDRGLLEQTYSNKADSDSWKSPATKGEHAKTRGGPPPKKLTVKGAPINVHQRRNAQIILDVAEKRKLSRKLGVCAIMVAIVESRLLNTSGGDADSVGLFQQRASWGTFEERHDPAIAANMFYNAALKVDQSLPHGTLCADVQRPAAQYRGRYAEHYEEANKIVTAWGSVGVDTETPAALSNGSSASVAAAGDYFFYRGDPPPTGSKKWLPENSWQCIQRLAEEVEWRAYFVAGVFYYIAEDRLFKSKPLLEVREFDDGILSLDAEYVTNKKTASVTLKVSAGRWSVPPGSIVVLREMGPWSGRWLVTDYERDLFSPEAEITLKKPRPRLLEPAEQFFEEDGSGWATPQKKQDEMPQHSIVAGAPKQIIDKEVLPLARKCKMNYGTNVADVVAANARHGKTVYGTRSDHEGPPDEAWAVDMSNGYSPTPEMDTLAADIAQKFGIPWDGAGLSSKIKDGYRYQLIYRTHEGGNHYNHVHFGIKITSIKSGLPT